MEIGGFIGLIIGISIFIIIYALVISKFAKRSDDELKLNQDILSELQKHTELLTSQNDLLQKLLSETSDSEKAELTEKLNKVSQILNN